MTTKLRTTRTTVVPSRSYLNKLTSPSRSMRTKQHLMAKSVIVASVLGLSAASALAGSVTYDFTTDPTTGANPIQVYQTGFADGSGNSVYWKADGGNPGGFLGLTWPLGSSSSIILFPDI